MNRVVMASWFGDGELTEATFKTNVLDALVWTNQLGPRAVSPYAYPGDWSIAFENIGTYDATEGEIRPYRDYYQLVAKTSGYYFKFRVYAKPEARSLIDGDAAEAEGVEFSFYDPDGCVTISNNVLTSTGSAGTVIITATDTNGTVKTSMMSVTPVGKDSVLDAFAAEDASTERYIWEEAVFSRLATVSTDPEDMVTVYGCRTVSNWGDKVGVLTPWSYPRSLGRFGTGGRMVVSEWPGVSDFSTTRRKHCVAENGDFFWPELATNLWCYSINCHESLWSEADGMSALAVASHYFLAASHVDWMWSRTPAYSPKFRCGHGDGDIVHCAYSGMKKVAVIRNKSGDDSDIALWYTTNEIPAQCIAKFLRGDVASRLSSSGFARVPGFVLTCHQTVSPVCLSSLWGSALGSWKPMPGVGDLVNNYMRDAADVPANATGLEHMTHMFDSSDPVFYVSPRGQVIPSFQVMYATPAHNGSSGPGYDDYKTDQISERIRSHSGGAEDLSYWTFEELWCGGTNTLETASAKGVESVESAGASGAIRPVRQRRPVRGIGTSEGNKWEIQ